tara:strand:- start:223 stop:423 length:201 start_codon:yes stop_codon:yes gene_type:complete
LEKRGGKQDAGMLQNNEHQQSQLKNAVLAIDLPDPQLQNVPTGFGTEATGEWISPRQCRTEEPNDQ